MKGLEGYAPPVENQKMNMGASDKSEPEKKMKSSKSKAIYIPVTVAEHREIKVQAAAEGESIMGYCRKKLNLDAQ